MEQSTDSCYVCPRAYASFLHLLSLSSKTDHTQTPPTLTMSGTSPLKAVGGVPSESGQSSGVGLTFFISCRGGSWQRPCQALCLSWKWRRRARVALGCVYVLWWALTHCEEPLTRQFVVEIVILQGSMSMDLILLFECGCVAVVEGLISLIGECWHGLAGIWQNNKWCRHNRQHKLQLRSYLLPA